MLLSIIRHNAGGDHLGGVERCESRYDLDGLCHHTTIDHDNLRHGRYCRARRRGTADRTRSHGTSAHTARRARASGIVVTTVEVLKLGE
jgi:hypothetical protein